MKSGNLVKAELLISHVLRYGVLLCLFVTGVGLAARFATPSGNEALVAALTSGQAPEFHPLSGAALAQGLAHYSPDAVISLGLILLIALPIIRVALTTLIFLRERDWPFFGITLVVLSVLLSGIFLGRAL